MSWARRHDGAHLPRQGADDAILSRLPPRSGAAFAAEGSGRQHDLETAGRCGSARPRADEAIWHPRRTAYPLLCVPSMTTRACPSRFDLERLREITGRGGKRFWSSLEELIDEEGFRAWLAAEFPAASSMFDDPGRRQFLKLMGASLLLAGLGGCSEQTNSDHALPYVNQPEEMVPGVPRYYATAVTLDGYAQPVIATTYSGRPTKLDGNPDHPMTRGKSDAFMQSAVFGLYDPERSKIPAHNGVAASWAAFDGALAALRTRAQARNGDG